MEIHNLLEEGLSTIAQGMYERNMVVSIWFGLCCYSHNELIIDPDVFEQWSFC